MYVNKNTFHRMAKRGNRAGRWVQALCIYQGLKAIRGFDPSIFSPDSSAPASNSRASGVYRAAARKSYASAEQRNTRADITCALWWRSTRPVAITKQAPNARGPPCRPRWSSPMFRNNLGCGPLASFKCSERYALNVTLRIGPLKVMNVAIAT